MNNPAHWICLIQESEFSLLPAFESGIGEYTPFVEDLVDICNETAAEAEFISLVFEVLNPPGMGREVVLPEGSGGVKFPFRNSDVLFL